MAKPIVLSFLLSLAMTSCITVSMLTQTPSAPPFVTSTLPPTKVVTPRPAFTPSLVPTAEADRVSNLVPCKYGAVLLTDVTFPDNSHVPGGQIFTKTWKLKNTGTCPWEGFTIHYASGERMSALESAAMPETPAGGSVDLSVDLTSPARDGIYTTYFSMQSATGETIAIGTEKTFYVRVIVGEGSAPALAQPPSISPGVPAFSIGTISIYCKYSYSENANYVQELASLINQARGNASLPALDLNPLLTQAAQGHSIDMACNNFLGHEGSDGSRFGALVHATGYPNSFQEIIGIGTPNDAMDQWAADIGHWEIVLNALATEMGIGYAYSPDSNFGGYFTVDLH